MSLRLRLILAFFALSVVPLGAVTVFTYTSNVKAVKNAAAREADLLAGELTQRMQLLTAQLSERVEHLMDLQEAAAPTVQASAPKPASQPEIQVVTAQPMTDAEVDEKVAQALGEAAMLLNNVDLTGMRRLTEPFRSTASGRGGRGDRDGRGGQGGRPSGPPPNPLTPPAAPPASATNPPPATTAGSAATTLPVPAPSSPPPPPADGRRMWAGRAPRPDQYQYQFTTNRPPRSGGGGAGDRGSQTTTGQAAAAGQSTQQATSAGSGSSTGSDRASRPQSDTNALRIDLSPLRQQLYQQMFPQGLPTNLTDEQRQAIGREMQQRLLGIQQGFQMSAAEMQKRAKEAQRVADEQSKAETAKAQAAAAEAENKARTTVALKPMQKKTAISGNRIDVSMEQDGKVVQHVNAELNLLNVLQTVFSTTRTDRGEVPFAVGKDGHLYTPSEADKKRIEGLGAALKPDGPPSATSTIGDWIVVTTADPSGSGLRFGIARPVGDSMDALKRTAARNASFGLLFIGLAIAGIVPLSSRLTRNLSTLTEGVGRIAQGDFSVRVPVRSQDEVGRLAGAFNQMAADVERHQLAAVEQERIRRELELGRQIQHEMLPHAPMRFGLTEVQGVSVPAREVGGDFFNYFEVGDGQIALLVGDVSGKGVGAALLMANIQASLRTRLSLGRDLSAIADAIDHDIEANSPGPVYATLFVGILDPAARTLRYVNAGHHPQYVLRNSGGLERMASTGLPVGLFAGKGYTERQLQLGEGDVIFFYTDGCVEAENAAHEMFGAERLEKLLTAGPVSRSADLLHRVEAGVKEFRGGVEPFDDETMMAVRVG